MAKLKPKSFESFDEGNYEVDSLEFFTTDSSGSPIFVTQDGKYGAYLVARYRTKLGSDDGPPGSIRPEQLPLLVHAFGGDVTRLPTGDMNQALSVAERLIRDADKLVRVTVRGEAGWIGNVAGMMIPEGEYLFKFSRITTRNREGEIDWRVNDFGVSASVELFVESSGDGTQNPFKGCPVTVYLNREPFAILRALTPTTVKGLLGDTDTELKLLDEMARTESKDNVIFGRVAIPKNGKRPRVIKHSLQSMKDGKPVPTSGPEGATISTEEDLEPAYIEHLYTAIAEAVEKTGGKAFDTAGKLTAAGKAWCKETLKPLCKEHKAPNKFDAMSQENVVDILGSLGRDDLIGKITGDSEDEDEDW